MNSVIFCKYQEIVMQSYDYYKYKNKQYIFNADIIYFHFYYITNNSNSR